MAADLAVGHQLGTFQVVGEMRSETKAGVQLRCKVDDLAIVTKCGVQQWIGLLVRVVERSTDGRSDWLAEIQGPGVLARGATTGRIAMRRRVLLDDWNLTPIRGQGLPDEKARQDLEASEA